MNQKVILVVLIAVVAFVVAFSLSFFTAMAGLRTGNAGWTYAVIGASIAAVVGAVYLGLRNNRSVATASDDEKRTVLTSPPGAGRARLFVYRDGFVAKLAGFDVILDGETAAQLKSPRFVPLDVMPGAHAVEVVAQGKRRGPLAIALGEGEMAVVHVGMGMMGLTLTRVTDDGTVRAKLAAMPMVRPDPTAGHLVFA